MNDEVTARLENWGFVGKNLHGEVYDDKKGRWKDGHSIKLSRITVPAGRWLKEGMVIKTLSNSYLLGKEAGV